jgi:N,N'-diacetyl-8-epilegionaminate cytidylyltransferase
VVTQPDGYSRLVIPPSKGISRRQDVPVVYDMTTVGYVVRPSFVVEADGLFAGRVRSVHVPAERALDIDTVFDLQVAEYVMADRHRKAN